MNKAHSKAFTGIFLTGFCELFGGDYAKYIFYGRLLKIECNVEVSLHHSIVTYSVNKKHASVAYCVVLYLTPFILKSRTITFMSFFNSLLHV